MRTLWDPIVFTLTKAKIIRDFKNFNSKFKIWQNVFLKSIGRMYVFKCENSYPCVGTFIVELHHHHYHHISFIELDHLLTRSGLKHPEVSSKVYHDSFCQFWTILDKLLEYRRSWIQHVNRMPRNRLPRVMKYYSPTSKTYVNLYTYISS